MKIAFFKNESDFHPRTSYCWTNAEQVVVDFKLKKAGKYLQFLLVIPLVVFLLSLKLGSDWPFCIIIAILCLPAHELCHALFCRLSGRKAEGIYFFPSKRVFSFTSICKTRLRRMEQNAGSAVRGISAYSADVCPCNSSSFYFIFQGMAADYCGI